MIPAPRATSEARSTPSALTLRITQSSHSDEAVEGPPAGHGELIRQPALRRRIMGWFETNFAPPGRRIPDGGLMTFDPEGPLSRESEQELMRQLVAGDEDAIRTLYARFGRSVYTLGFRLLGSNEGAEELTQDVFLTAWRKGNRFDSTRGRLSTWLMAIAHNMAVDRLRHDRGAARPSLVFMEELPEPAPHDEDTGRLLSQAYFYGWTAREIAETDGIPLGTVKTRLRTALIKLRRAGAEEARAAARAMEGGPP
jgi:RNA polymerase sigma-70 factor (ECF subfamily)